MKIYMIAGEASGDLHGSSLIRQLKNHFPSLSVRAWGGERMQSEGAEVVRHYRELAFMGFTEVIMNLPTILNNLKSCKRDIEEYNPDAIVLIDYPGFNLRIAKFAAVKNIPVYYFISPQVWAWKASRVHTIKRVVRKMFVILPFEKDFYKKYNYDVEYVGHPLPEIIAEQKKNFSDRSGFMAKNSLPDKPIIAILPGSRTQEIRKMLPLMLSVSDSFPEYQFVIAAAPSQPMQLYQEYIDGRNVKIIAEQTYELLSHSKAALVTSGTATLETALLRIPQVVCYKGGKVSYLIARWLVKIRFISLVNLILNKEAVKELIQDELNHDSIKHELNRLLDQEVRGRIINDYDQLIGMLNTGGAAEKTAEGIAADVLSFKQESKS